MVGCIDGCFRHSAHRENSAGKFPPPFLSPSRIVSDSPSNPPKRAAAFRMILRRVGGGHGSHQGQGRAKGSDDAGGGGCRARHCCGETLVGRCRWRKGVCCSVTLLRSGVEVLYQFDSKHFFYIIFATTVISGRK
jgi:hypothetical protein